MLELEPEDEVLSPPEPEQPTHPRLVLDPDDPPTW